MEDDMQKLRTELAQCHRTLSTRENEIRLLNTRLTEANENLSYQETENASLKRLIERANAENDHLLQKLDEYEDNEKTLNNEIIMLKEALTKSTMARDDVIEKLKDVSVETRELIENCDKAYEESELFKTKTHELEEQINVLKHLNDTLRVENENLHLELETRNVEIKSLQCKLESFNSQQNNLWRNDISTVNNELRDIEKQIKTIIANLQNCEAEKRNLEREIEHVKSGNLALQEQNAMKDNMISKQNKEFMEMKSTVDEYHSEILRLDAELKDCHKRVETLNQNLEAASSYNPDATEFMHFRRSLMRFGGLENIEKLLLKLQVLQEIEQFFEKNLSPHVQSSNNPEGDSDSIVTDKKQDTINRIKNYLEKALSAIEKLNDKMTRLRNEYESKLRAKSSEISTLREVLSNTILYNKILEQTLQQCKDKVQLDETLVNETDELLIVNETLLDGFDTLKQLYRISEQSNSNLYAKAKQLKFFTKLIELYVRRTFDESDASKIAIYKQKIADLFLSMRYIFEEISMNEPSAQKLIECQRVMEKCERSLITKDYLKNTVENMSQEVKRLTSKVEHEMTEKICEIEALKGEVDNMKTDNRDLVNKIKSCNREIVSLSTENYDLNEKLESLTRIQNQCDILKEELETVKKCASRDDASEASERKMRNLKQVCSTLKSENANIRYTVQTFVDENKCVLIEAQKLVRAYASDLSKLDESFVHLHEKCCDICDSQQDLRLSVAHLQQEINADLSTLAETLAKDVRVSCPKEMLQASLISLKETCSVLKKENEDLKAGITTFVKLTSDDVIPVLHSKFTQLLRNIDASAKHKDDFKSSISVSVENIASVAGEVNKSNKSARSVYEEMANEFSKQMQTTIYEIQKAVIFTFENIKSSFAIRNDEMIKEMQEMNTELKKRGEVISGLNQSLTDAGKDNKRILEQIAEKESAIAELTETLNDIRTRYSTELVHNAEVVENLKVELENLCSQIRSKDDTIATLKNDIQKQKEIQDGDVSSVGTISKTDEVSRLKEVEDTFEERYMKLKIIAVKMKKNIADLNQELKEEKAERATLQTKLVAGAKQAKISQALQDECDKLNDDLELKVNEIKELKKIIQAFDRGGEDLKSQISDYRKKIETLERNVIVLENEKLELETKVETMSSQLEGLHKEKLAEEIVKKEKDKENQLLKHKIKEFEDAKERVQNDLENAKKEIRKQGALTLEMRDFEKTISDLRTDVEAKEALMKGLRTKLMSTAAENESLVETVKRLEEQVSSYIESNKTADNQILTLNKAISEHECNAKEKEACLKQLTQQLESEKSTNERLMVQLADLTSEVKSLKDSFRDREALLIDEMQTLYSKLRVVQDTLCKKENEYSELKEDYESYKARAHSLLQKMKNENNVKSHEEKLQEEIDTLSQTVRDLKKRLDNSTCEVENQKAQVVLMETVKEKLQNRVKELMASLTEKSEEVKAAKAEYKACKLNTDTLVGCYKAEIESLKASLEEMKTELQKASVKTEKAIANPDEAPAEVRSRSKTLNSECCENGTVCNVSAGSHDSELEQIDEAKTFNKRRKHSLVPLEKLLQPFTEENGTGCESFGTSGNETELRANIKLLEEQVKYLTRILNESEKNAARNEQQVALLKDEIRRMQRAFEREPHLRNTEYLKNVLMKFVTLPVGDEKSQLVIVLETMLKLTPNEKQTLSVIAKGQKFDQKPASGWTSYLGW